MGVAAKKKANNNSSNGSDSGKPTSQRKSKSKQEQKQGDAAAGQEEDTTLLTDPHRMSHDLRLLARAVKERWPVRKRDVVVKRLLGIVEKTQVEVMTKTGPASLDGPADANAVAAARVLVAMEAQNQDDQHHNDGETVNHKHSGAVGVAAVVRQEALNDPEYLEFCRSRIGQGDRNTGGVCIDGESRPVEGGQAPRVPGPCRHGNDQNGRAADHQ